MGPQHLDAVLQKSNILDTRYSSASPIYLANFLQQDKHIWRLASTLCKTGIITWASKNFASSKLIRVIAFDKAFDADYIIGQQLTLYLEL